MSAGAETSRSLGRALSTAEAMELPRMQVGYPPQHLVLTLFADYSLERPVPSAALVSMLADFDVSTAGARAAITRLARRGLLVTSRRGRNTAYAITERCAALTGDARYLTYAYTGAIELWDHRWTVVAYSVSEEQRAQRAVLRTRLRWLGFAPLQDGLWVSPHRPSAALREVLTEVAPAQCTVFSADLLEQMSTQGPMDAWDLSATRAAFDDFLAEFTPVADRFERGALGDVESLVRRTQVIYRWFNLANEHADLPATLLPDGWPGRPSRRLFLLLADGLAEPAARRIVDHLDRHGTVADGAVRALTAAEILA